jgi:hypothetical protein
MACRSLAEAARFRLFLSATAGQTPHELGYLGPLLGEAAGVGTATLKGFRELMKHLGIGRAKGRWTNWQWEANERDRARMARLLYTGPDAIGLRRRPEDIAGWPEVELGLAGGSVRRPTGWAADLRFRQKASLLRIGGTADLVEDLLGNGFQVAVSVTYLETAALLAAALAARHWRVGAITGAMSNAENEASRLAFQTGRLDVVAFTATESISLHQGELPGGEKPRALVAHDLRYSAIQMAQIEGRCHRNGVAAAVWYAFAENTIEERIAATVIARMLAMDGMAGDDTALLAAIAEVIEAAAEERAA